MINKDSDQWKIIRASDEPDLLQTRMVNKFREFIRTDKSHLSVQDICSLYATEMKAILYSEDPLEVIRRTAEPLIYPDIAAIAGAWGTISNISTAINAYMDSIIIQDLLSPDDIAEINFKIIEAIRVNIMANLDAREATNHFIGLDMNENTHEEYLNRTEEINKYLQIIVRFATECGLELIKGGFDEV